MTGDGTIRPSRDLTVLIPARAGSQRVPGKNLRLLGGVPLVQWTLDAVQAAGVARVIVSTDDPGVAALARAYGGLVHARQAVHATAEAPDIGWVRDVLPLVTTPHMAICRPTSPFRSASTIRRGYAAWLGAEVDSIRAVVQVTAPHPAKMWQISDGRLVPIWPGVHRDGTPYHSSPTQGLPAVYAQTGGLEIVHRAVIVATGTISGHRIGALLVTDLEGVDINTEADMAAAVALVDAEAVSRA